MKRASWGAGLIAAVGFFAAVQPSLAQFYDPYDRPRQRPYFREDPYDRPRPRPYFREDPYARPDPYGGYRPSRRPVLMGNLCVTSRGNCYTRPQPNQSSCACNIPGFGVKRGAILAQPRY